MSNDLNFSIAPKTPVPASARRRKKKTSPWPFYGAGLAVLLVLGGAATWYLTKKSIALAPLASRNIPEMVNYQFTVVPITENVPRERLKFSLEGGPAGASLDPKSGRFSWRPTEAQGPGKYQMQIRVGVDDRPDLAAQQPLTLLVEEANQPPKLAPISDQVLAKPGIVKFAAAASDDDVPAQQLKFAMQRGTPPGCKIDPATGEFTWDLQASKPGTSYPVSIVVTDPAGKQDQQTFIVRLERVLSPLEEFVTWLESQRFTVKIDGNDPEPIYSGSASLIEANGGRLNTYEYATAEDAKRDVSQASRLTPEQLAGAKVYQADRLIVAYSGKDPRLLDRLKSRFGAPRVPLATAPTTPASDMPLVYEPQTTSAPADELAKAILELYKSRKLLVPKEYTTLRHLFVQDFERQHEADLRKAYGSDYAEMTAWLDAHSHIKEEFYTAIDPQHDKVAAALSLFNTLRKEFSKQLATYYELAIATAVTWDEGKGIYEYVGHQTRTHAKMPAGLAGAVENFKYLVDAERLMEGRIQYLPWEFLTHVVNHKTPINERQWALQNYLSHRSMFGACYSDVPYDYQMLKTNSATCKLSGSDYSLSNIRQLGGVCAMQADFAGRVGKSLGVPAEYVTGESNSGDLHAWVMWVELKRVTPASISFSLESHGRYNLDQYYVGKLKDPQTGRPMTDRELELALQNIGSNPKARRHAALLMRAYPKLREQAKLDVNAQLLFLRDVIRLSPGNEESWLALAKLSKDGLIDKANQKRMSLALIDMFNTFAMFPDFTWKMFDDLISFQPDAKQRLSLYERLVQLYEQAKRPDLACEARLKLSDYLVAEHKQLQAAEGLGMTIKKFPDEGRYVPKMLDKLEVICKDLKGADDLLSVFYQEFLPMVPKTRGDEPSIYCMKMYQRGADRFREKGLTQLARTYDTELATLKGKAH